MNTLKKLFSDKISATCLALALMFFGLGLFSLPGKTPSNATINSWELENVAWGSDVEPIKYVPIELVKVGDRLPALNPIELLDTSLGPIDSTWKRLELLAPKDDGSSCRIVLLRPSWWIYQQNAQVGHTIFVSVPECGIDGEADVLAIDETEPIRDDIGRVVIGTFHHTSARVMNLVFEGDSTSIGVTPNHAIWSQDRQAFVRADELQVGERLKTLLGETTLESVSWRSGTEEVFNLEVEGEHVYYVGNSQVLAHNNTLCDGHIKRRAEFYADGRRTRNTRRKYLAKFRETRKKTLSSKKYDYTPDQINEIIEAEVRKIQRQAVKIRRRRRGEPDPSSGWGRVAERHHGPKPPADASPTGKWHGHHIVHKGAEPGTELFEITKRSKEILEKYKINWLDGPENVVWAPHNWEGLHTIAEQKKILEALERAHKTKDAANVRLVLQRAKVQYRRGNLPKKLFEE